VISITQCNLLQACWHLYSNHLPGWSSTFISSSVCCIQTSHIQRMVEYRQTLLELAHKPYLELKAISFNSDVNKTTNYMSIHACITTKSSDKHSEGRTVSALCSSVGAQATKSCTLIPRLSSLAPQMSTPYRRCLFFHSIHRDISKLIKHID
jgi:hypothetical protein